MKVFLTLIQFSIFSLAVFSQPAEITVEYITIQNGLAHNNVSSIIKDQTGLMWFGTNDGLTRYDGYSLKNFRPLNEFLFIIDLHETPDGILWCASTNGLYCFDLKTERFIASFKENPNISNTIPSNRINGITRDTDSSLWVTTNKGLCHLSNISKHQIESSEVQIRIYNKENSTFFECFRKSDSKS